ncbi:MAG: type II toxin-antitoxin system prevent-host-death family antitoxin [Rhodoglobus sp.]
MGIRELRQQASDLVRRASAGEEIIIAVSGYPTARLVPLEGRRWRKGRDIAGLFSAAADPTWQLDRDSDGIDERPADPWERAGA